jgi:DNA primase
LEAQELKDYLLEDTERILKLLEDSGFHSFSVSSGEIRCALPDGDNGQSVSVRLEEMIPASIFSRDSYHSDLFGMLQQVRDESFADVMAYIHAKFGISRKYHKQKFDLLSPLMSLYSGESAKTIKTNKLYESSILSRYIHLPHINLIQEGIDPSVIDKFRICFDPQQSRIIFPHYDWKEPDKIAGVVGRTTMDAELARKLDVPKYWNYISGYLKRLNLYGYLIGRDTIAKQRMMVIFEGEKSVLKQYTYTHGEGYSVSVGGHEISEEQIEFISKEVPTDVEIVVAFDQDVITNPVVFAPIVRQLMDLTLTKKVSVITDKLGLLKSKQAPVDNYFEVWDYLLDQRITVNETYARKLEREAEKLKEKKHD